MAYTPASTLTTSPGYNHAPAAWYKRTALDNLKQMLVFMEVADPDDIPRRNGTTVQFFRYNLFTSNTTPSSEGTVGTGITPSTATLTATVSEYSDFVTLSTLITDTSIDRIVENTAAELGYRAGLTVDTLIRTELESNTGNDTAPLSGGSMALADIRSNVALLKGVNVRPRNGGMYTMIAHPYVTHDIRADNTSGGFIDIKRYAEPSNFMNSEIGSCEGARVLESTNVGTSGTAPNVLYASYLVGRGALGAVSLAGRGPGRPARDPNTQQAFRVNIITPRPSGEMSDPEGKIGSAISYYFIFVAVLLDETTLRYRTINADAALI